MTGPHDLPGTARPGDPVPRSTARGVVVDLPDTPRKNNRHEPATRQWVAQRAADLLGYRYAGSYQDAAAATDRAAGEHLYFVPQSTLEAAHARELGIAGEQDLLGGVVPHRFVASKAISHPLVEGARHVPEGWSHALGAALEPVVLPGFSAFGLDDARKAGRQMLERHPAIRIKPGAGIGGLHQSVVADAGQLDAALGELDETGVGQLGVVLELNLDDVATYSVGTTRIGALEIAYLGVQRLTRNHRGAEVYGGSDLACVRGGSMQLVQATQDPEQRRIVELAIRYDEAVSRAYPQLLASRRNYDIVVGRRQDGTLQHGVLEQSWRIGGASPAELRALMAFAADPSLRIVGASSHEVYELIEAPAGAHVYFSDVDPVVGAITKYSCVDLDGREA